MCAFLEMQVSHQLTPLMQLKDVELTGYWSAGITSPCRAKAAQVPSQGETIHQWGKDEQIYTPTSVQLSVCLSVFFTFLPLSFLWQWFEVMEQLYPDESILFSCWLIAVI